MIVAKFGGTSVADAAAVNRLIGIVRARISERPLVVVSALAGVTDALLGLARQAEREEGSSVDEMLDSLVHRHEEMARALPGAAAALDSIVADAEELRGELGRLQDRAATPAEL